MPSSLSRRGSSCVPPRKRFHKMPTWPVGTVTITFGAIRKLTSVATIR